MLLCSKGEDVLQRGEAHLLEHLQHRHRQRRHGQPPVSVTGSSVVEQWARYPEIKKLIPAQLQLFINFQIIAASELTMIVYVKIDEKNRPKMYVKIPTPASH